MSPDHVPSNLPDRVLALAGTFQSVALVQQVARTGDVDEAPFATCVTSVLRIDSRTTEAVYGERAHLTLGLHTLVRQLGEAQARDIELTRYWVGLLALERKLSRRSDMLMSIGRGLESLVQPPNISGPPDEDLVRRLAQIYKQSISTLTPRIMVSGEPRFLNEERNAERIRALLLSAIRSTVLWRQLGGTRLGLLFSRQALVTTARRLLEPEQPGGERGSIS